jgi:hypothetical protein
MASFCGAERCHEPECIKKFKKRRRNETITVKRDVTSSGFIAMRKYPK